MSHYGMTEGCHLKQGPMPGLKQGMLGTPLTPLVILFILGLSGRVKACNGDSQCEINVLSTVGEVLKCHNIFPFFDMLTFPPQ